MKKRAYYLLPSLIGIFLFVIPFFWLKPGWMDLGGDASRLYFYDPANYLHSLPLYGVTPDGIGTEVTGFFLLPFVLLLVILKWIFQSSWLLITLFNSTTLVVSFISIFLIIREFIEKNSRYNNKLAIISFAGSAAGLFYILSPMLINNGWSKALYVHNNVFINPLIFFFLLKYIHTKKNIYILIAILISFIFAANFSPSPYFFSFFPLAIFCLVLYAITVKHVLINIKELIAFGILFIGIHAFHLLPMFYNFFSANSAVSHSTFSAEGKIIRGLSYFVSVASSTELVDIIFTIVRTSSSKISFALYSIVFPLILLGGIFLQRKLQKKGMERNNLFFLLWIFFFITLFFVSGKLTNIGFTFYKSLFNIPGFSMFRNYVGQFSHTYIFFYSLLIGLSLFYIFMYVKIWQRNLIMVSLIVFFCLLAWPFIRGDMIHYVMNPGSKTTITVPIKMDPQYEKVLEGIRNDRIDAKYLTLPLTDFAYQMIAGEQGGAYQGPSTIAYLAGKKDFSGYQDFTPYSDLFFSLVKQKDYASIQKLFSALNIKYIFFNSDPYIYDNNFPAYPYQYVKQFFPTQDSYRKFLNELDLEKEWSSGTYALYSIKNKYFIPHFYVPKTKSITNNSWSAHLVTDLQNSDTVFLDIQTYKGKAEYTYIEAENTTLTNAIRNNYHFHQHDAFIAHRLESIYYPVVPLLEKRQLAKNQTSPDQYIDRSLLILSKRVNELSLPKSVGVLHRHWEEPKLWEFYKWSSYNSWEASLARYEQQVEGLLYWVSQNSPSKSWEDIARIKINEQLFRHQVKILHFIESSDNEEEYLSLLCKKTFKRLFALVGVPVVDSSVAMYKITIPKNNSGYYELYLKNMGVLMGNLSDITLEIDGKGTYLPGSFSEDNINRQMIKVFLTEGEHILKLTFYPKNMVKDVTWQPSVVVNGSASQDVLTFKNTMQSDAAFIEIKQEKSDIQYVISFDYLTRSDNFALKFFEFAKSREGNLVKNIYFEKIITSDKWRHHQSIVTSSPLSKSILLEMQSKNKKSDSNIQIRNLSVVELPNPGTIPRILFKKSFIAEDSINKNPNITFRKINPTKYKLSVTQARESYMLVFSEAFSNNWKVYPTIGNNSSQRKDKANDAIVASYFDGKVREGKHVNEFLNFETFETFGKKSLREDRHFLANGYANVWEIRPEDVGNRSSYELIIELQSQQLFYKVLAVSVVSVGICIGLLIRKGLKRINAL